VSSNNPHLPKFKNTLCGIVFLPTLRGLHIPFFMAVTKTHPQKNEIPARGYTATRFHFQQNTLRHYTGDRNALGQAEKFLLELINIADFKLRIEAMTFRQVDSIFSFTKTS
jgi:hypothetical protein